jgi:hypothetical protein
MFDLAFSADSIVRNPLLMIAHPPPSLGLDQITNINSSFSKRISHNEESVNVYFMIGQFIWRVAHIRPIKLGGPHLDFEMWETMNPSPPLFVLSNSGF